MGSGGGHHTQSAGAATDGVDDLAELPVVNAATGELHVLQALRPAVQQEQQNEPDSVDEAVGAGYPDAVKDELRELARPPWDEEDSSLDPISDLEEYWRHNFRMPPEAYDAVQAVAQQELEELEASRAPLSGAAAERVALRRALVEGAPREEVVRLKLAAYHRGQAQLRAAREARCGLEAREAALAAAGAPLDVVPAPLIEQTPAQFVAANKARLEARHREAQEPAHQRGGGAHAGSHEESGARLIALWGIDRGASERESSGPLEDWAPAGWDAPSWQQAPVAATGLAAALARVLPGPARVTGAEEPRRDAGEADSRAASTLDVEQEGDPQASQWEGWQAHTPAYLDRQRRQEALQRQQRLQAGAFWLGLALAAGVGLAKWLRRGRKGRRGGTRAAAQRRPPVAA